MIIAIPNVLSAAQVAEARELLDSTQWVDGRITAGHQSARAKDNQQLPEDSPVARTLGEIIVTALERGIQQNPRAKMLGIRDGFVKLMASRTSGTVIGGVVVSPKASELILPIAIAIEHRLTVDQLAEAFSVYPSLSGSITDAARAMHIVR